LPPQENDALSQEVALLQPATGDLRAGRFSEALKSLDEHQRRFPNGILTEERRAARAQALCSLGRRSEAQAELSLLAAQSLAVANARHYCDETSK
jgi:outer membrane protein assembly factor BamD (BamD/ComL family)